MPNLLWMLIIPFLAPLVIFFSSNGKHTKSIAFILSLIPFALLAYDNWNWIGSRIEYNWLPQLSIAFNLRVDGLSLIFLFLTSVIIPISILSTPRENIPNQNVFYGLILVLQGLLIGFFTAQDLALFTIFWEAMLLPLYFLINMWGGHDRHRAALKFLIYMIAGSALMVVAVLSLYFASAAEVGTGTFDLGLLSQIAENAPYASIAAAIFMLAFAVKTPLFPFHAWLPETYYQASTSSTILLSAILSKAGIYGIARIGLGLFPAFIQHWSSVLLGLSIAGVLYGALAAWNQNDYKRLIAYSSFSHVNFILAGLFVWNQTAHTGAIVQAFNHGITIAGLFLVAGWLQERLQTTSINAAGGLAAYLTKLCWLTLFFVLSSVALPGLNGFIGELLILTGLFAYSPWLAAVLGLSIILSVIYMLRWLQKMYFGPLTIAQPIWKDITWRELAIALPLIILVLWVGLYPGPILSLF